MKPLDPHYAIWLARGEALGILLRRGLRASTSRLRDIRLTHRLRALGLARYRPDPPPVASGHNASASPGMMADLHRSTGAAPALTQGLEPGND